MNTSFLDVADRIGARLCRDAIWWGRRCNWIAGYEENSAEVVHQSLGPDLFRGTCGIALFLFHLWAATGEKIFRQTAAGALAHSLSRVGPGSPGFFTGLSGLCYAAMRAAAITGEENFSNEALRIAKLLTAGEANSDLVSGSAGCIAPLLSLYRQHGAEFLLDLAVRHGELLVDRALPQETGWAWKTLPNAPRAMPCYGLGASGIAAALLELSCATSQPHFRRAATEGFRYIESVFDDREENWPDYRVLGARTPDGVRPVFSGSWCHGVAGIGLAYLRAWQLAGDGAYRDQAGAAIRTTRQLLQRTLPQLNFSLCHGAMGMAELLLSAGNVLDNPDYLSSAQEFALAGVQMYEEERVCWPCATASKMETPDLMLGLAGIGYSLLRLHDTGIAPSILLVVPDGATAGLDTPGSDATTSDPWPEHELAGAGMGVAGSGQNRS